MAEARWYERPNDVVRGLAPRRRGRLTHHPWTLVDQGAQQCSQRDHLVLCWLDTRQLVAPVQALPLGGRLRDTVEGYEQRRNSLSYPNPASVESAECARRLLVGGIVGHLRRTARPRRRGYRALVTRAPGSRKPAPSLRPGQVQRISQQPYGVCARRPHPVGLKVTHGALAHFGAGRQLLLRQQGPVPARPQKCTE